MAHEQQILELRKQYMQDGSFNQSQYSFDRISPQAFKDLLAQYDNIVPASLAALDKQRLETIPAALKQRSDDPCLTKDELATLMDWKLSHGKFRPMLKSLIQQNPAAVVVATTTQGFGEYKPADASSLKVSLTTLIALRGVGPATASLLLSVYDPANVVFFSDEVFRWACYDGAGAKGWARPIKYTMKEYMMLAGRVEEFKARIEAVGGCLEVEKVAYVIGKMAGEGGEDDGNDDGVTKKQQQQKQQQKRKGSREEEHVPVRKRGKPSSPAAEANGELVSRRSTRSRK